MEMRLIQPLWYHPTSVLLIDDDETLLRALGKKIDQRFPCYAHKNPEAALEHLKKNVLPIEKLSQDVISEVEPIESSHLSTENVAINFAPLRTNLNKPDRYNTFVTAIVDKVMNEMDGLDFCQIVKKSGLPVKLILLTGNADADEAIEAFNSHIIDAFVKKSEIDVMSQINHHIKTLSFQTFCESSTKLLGVILNKFPLLNKQIFFDFFKEICRKNNIIEYYLLDSSGSYLLITAEGVAKILFVKSADDFKNAYDMINGDLNVSKKLLNELKERIAFPFTGTQNYFASDTSQWAGSMIVMKKMEALDLHYTVVDLHDSFPMSLNRYINDIWKPAII